MKNSPAFGGVAFFEINRLKNNILNLEGLEDLPGFCIASRVSGRSGYGAAI